MKIVVTIPAFNEGDTIEQVINGIKKTMDGFEYNYEIIVVDDGSKDNTKIIAENAGAVVYSSPYNMGLAETFRIEMKKALDHEADVIVHIDADGQYRAEDIPLLINALVDENYDLVLGSRFAGTIEEMPFIKKIGNRLFSRVLSQITNVKITDGQTGFRVFTKEVAEKIEIISTHTYTQEQIIKSVRSGFKIKEVPIYFAKRISGESKLISNPFEYAIRAWINLFRIHRDNDPFKFFGTIGFTLMVLSLIIFMYSMFISGNLMDITVTVLFLSGIQIILFGFLAEMIKRG